MLLQRLATGATGVKEARYRQGPTRGSEALVRACAVYTQPAYAVQCETTHGVYEFCRGFCTLVLSLCLCLQLTLEQTPAKVASEYFTKDEMVQFRKPRRKKKVRRLKADDLLGLTPDTDALDQRQVLGEYLMCVRSFMSILIVTV